MDKRRTSIGLTGLTIALFAAGILAGCARDSGSDMVGKAKQAGAYNIAIMVGPAKEFVSPSQADKAGNADKMVRLSGAKPIPKEGKQRGRKKSGKNKVNHHVAVFVKKNNEFLNNVQVRISYRKAEAGESGLHTLPVALMKVAGAGKNTFHYGNNIHLGSGGYVFRITVNGETTTHFKLDIH